VGSLAASLAFVAGHIRPKQQSNDYTRIHTLGICVCVVEAYRQTLEMNNCLTIYVIYDHPLDFPNHFVVRRWYIGMVPNKPVPDAKPMLANTLTAARGLVPAGLACFPRAQVDQKQIVETWI
jgi:hypothetical protein